MKRLSGLFTALVILLFSMDGAAAEKLRILATTTHIAALVQAIGGDRVETVTAVKGGMCPGNFDTDPAVVKSMARAELLLHHPWEKWLQKLAGLIGNTAVESVAIEPAGSWMVPSNNLIAAQAVCGALSVKDPTGKKYFETDLVVYRRTVNTAASKARTAMAPYRGTKVICAMHQAEFLCWLGFDVVGQYGRSDDLTVAEIVHLVNTARQAQARLVVDNLQSGAEAGSQIASDAGCGHVTLCSFPVNTSYVATLEENTDLLQKALDGYRH